MRPDNASVVALDQDLGRLGHNRLEVARRNGKEVVVVPAGGQAAINFLERECRLFRQPAFDSSSDLAAPVDCGVPALYTDNSPTGRDEVQPLAAADDVL